MLVDHEHPKSEDKDRGRKPDRVNVNEARHNPASDCTRMR
jgi:hypothetical protein